MSIGEDDALRIDKRFQDLICQLGFESMMKVVRSKERGRFVVAERDLKKDELVFEENPYSFTINPIRSQFVCDFCCGYSKDDLNQQLKISCSECNDVFYCSEQCKIFLNILFF
jgi:hypothetical protein